MKKHTDTRNLGDGVVMHSLNRRKTWVYLTGTGCALRNHQRKEQTLDAPPLEG